MSAFSIVINMMGVFLPRPEPTVSECLLQLTRTAAEKTYRL
ncbi:hypothetical protein J008_04569 [Cryptococcus neoformans]|nr:hypothetical protein C362_04099 [Cryptococcus neoformans var. grubii Bt1]OXG19821.1 hypothetical protein C367_04514 [Cryptococcus neoformans var. grubii Ze90-1]OXH28047.1 hypothetical protein J008_04569 [Cryptococcus neoformans var. grubii]